MKYEVKFTSGFKKSFKKLNAANKNLFYEILDKLAAGKTLESKYKNHKLKGKYSGCNECQ